jgi:hypothetical protein
MDDPSGRVKANYALWCAGRVPVGSIGTIAEFDDFQHQIIWDKIRSSSDRFVFGTSKNVIPDFLEAIEESLIHNAAAQMGLTDKNGEF